MEGILDTMSSRSRRKVLVLVVNTTSTAVVYDSEGHSLAGGDSVLADPNDPKTAALIDKRILYVKEG